MTGFDSDLEDGLLGYWPVTRSPEGYVRDRSPEGNHGQFGVDARWIWFTNPRAVRHVGDRDCTYVGYLGGPSGTDIQVGAYDHDDGDLTRTTVAEGFSPDDHTNPSLLVADDGTVLVFWTGHNGEAINYARSERPEDVTAFGPTRSLSGESVTYPNPTAAPDGTLTLLYRDRTVTRDATDNRFDYVGDGHTFFRTSTDGGRTWSDPVRAVTAPEGHYSMYFVHATDDDGGVHLFYTDAERGGDAPKHDVRYCCFRDGSFHRADGAVLADAADLPLEKGDLELVYDSSEPGNHHTWVWDVAVDDGKPAVVYATFPSTLAHEYRYARWDGERWHDHHLADAGAYIEEGVGGVELHYSAGIALDKSDPTVAYGAVNRDDYRALRRFETETGGRTWASHELRRDEAGTSMRPVAPLNASEEAPVLWLSGSYPHMNASQTVLRGLPTDGIREPALSGDGEHGADLGIDPYPDRTFAEGLSVSALLRTRAPETRQTVLRFGAGIRLDVAREASNAVECTLAGEGDETTVSWDGLEAGDSRFVEASWDGEAVTLFVDGEAVDTRPFAGPPRFGRNAGWTLLKGEHMMAHGFRGAVAEIRLYNRATTSAESERLAERAR